MGKPNQPTSFIVVATNFEQPAKSAQTHRTVNGTGAIRISNWSTTSDLPSQSQTKPKQEHGGGGKRTPTKCAKQAKTVSVAQTGNGIGNTTESMPVLGTPPTQASAVSRSINIGHEKWLTKLATFPCKRPGQFSTVPVCTAGALPNIWTMLYPYPVAVLIRSETLPQPAHPAISPNATVL